MSLSIPTINEWEPNYSRKDVLPLTEVVDALCQWDYATSSVVDEQMCNVSNLYYNPERPN
jgi:hypothetical protein